MPGSMQEVTSKGCSNTGHDIAWEELKERWVPLCRFRLPLSFTGIRMGSLEDLDHMLGVA